MATQSAGDGNKVPQKAKMTPQNAAYLLAKYAKANASNGNCATYIGEYGQNVAKGGVSNARGGGGTRPLAAIPHAARRPCVVY